MLLQVGLIPAQSSSMASFRALFIMRTGAKKLLFTSTTFQWLSGKCPSLVSDENTGRPTCPYRGDGGEGSILRTTFFAYKKKKARERKALPKSHGPNVFCVAMIVLDLHLSSGHGVKLGKLETPC